ncbi:sensor histidine kinase [Streptomyces albogriseolus]|uniref:sensor histidine kinase n=1 Tax=Streptomyces albogriseolus TaxID=1887 RepID=UPI0036C6BD05
MARTPRSGAAPTAPGPGARRDGTASRPERREGGRHGRPPARTAPRLPESPLRSQLLRLAVLPPVAVALSACAAVLFTVRSSGTRPTGALWTVLGGATVVALAGIVIAAVAAERAARSVRDRVDVLRRGTARREADLHALVEALRNGEPPPPCGRRTEHGGDGDEFDQLSADLARAHDGAVTAVVQAARLSSQAGSEQKLEVFVNLARRLQSLVHREISILDELENEMEDPDLLKGLFHVDHLATRIRRHAENLAVLGGAVSRRQWSNPVPMTEVLRSAVAEVEQYSRVKLVPPVDGTLRGHAVADVIHLLAELVENATVFSAPHTHVLLRANLVTSGLAVEVEDRGLGMPVGEQDRMNALLADPDQVQVASLLADGRIGLFVVSQLARRHGIHVRLQTNIYGGVQAVLVVPQSLLGGEPAAVTGAPGTAAVLPVAGTGAGPTGRHTPALSGPVDTRADAPAHAPTNTATDASAAGNTAAGSTAPAHTPADGTPASPLIPAAHPARIPAASPGNGAVPPPLPLRGTRTARPTPAEAVPGVHHTGRTGHAAHGGPTAHDGQDGTAAAEDPRPTPLVPRTTPVRGTMGKPGLPRRRAQEHIAPQLRDGPAPRQDSEHVAGHDPQLMAAFQRGISLAESQPESPAPARPAVPAPRTDHTARHDGSASAG